VAHKKARREQKIFLRGRFKKTGNQGDRFTWDKMNGYDLETKAAKVDSKKLENSQVKAPMRENEWDPS